MGLDGLIVIVVLRCGELEEEDVCFLDCVDDCVGKGCCNIFVVGLWLESSYFYLYLDYDYSYDYGYEYCYQDWLFRWSVLLGLEVLSVMYVEFMFGGLFIVYWDQQWCVFFCFVII